MGPVCLEALALAQEPPGYAGSGTADGAEFRNFPRWPVSQMIENRALTGEIP